jgi:hypothetical protein
VEGDRVDLLPDGGEHEDLSSIPVPLWRRPINYVLSYFVSLKHVYSSRFLFLLILIQGLQKGYNYVLVDRWMFPLFQNLNVEAARYQVFNAFAMSPWSLKPLLGVISDLLFIFGTSKKFMLLFATVLGSGGSIVLYFGIVGDSAYIITGGMFLLSLLSSTSDLLSESKYSEKLRDNPESGSAVIVFVNYLQRLGYVAGFLSIGPMIEAKVYLVLCGIVALNCMSTFVPVLLNFLPEPVVEKDPTHHRGLKNLFFDLGKFKSNWKIFTTIIICGLCSPIVTSIPIIFEGTTALIVGNVVFFSLATCFITLSYFIFPTKVEFNLPSIFVFFLTLSFRSTFAS